ncbi:dihydropyrimidinase [Granulicella sp. dw_53]|uniref:dihydropyrimidinase n=1 Tax=Granulicella sp. dw_53 TaxID=2719792 RepID=UPI001BD6B32D|nr:dihydropyrimidinase [Granulicella sp. dw_53]
MGTLITNGKVVTARETFIADVLVEGRAIAEVRAGIDPAGHTIVDAAGMLVLPGGIDVHTHLDMPFGGTTSADDYEWGTRAAAIGGTTTVIDFALQTIGKRMQEAYATWRKKAEGKACIDYALHMAVTDLGKDGAWIDDVDAMVREGITSFKIFMAYPGVLMVDDATIFELMQRTAQLGALVCVHAENGTVIDAIVHQALAAGKTGPLHHALTRPTVAEAEAVHRVVALSELAGAKVYIVHVSSEDAMREVEAARKRGLPVMGETCTQYLVLSIEDDMGKPGFEDAKYVFTPPLRERKNHAPLWEALRQDVLQVVSTDHCPFRFADQKTLGLGNFTKIPNGGPGVENRMQLIYHHGVNEGRMTLERFVEVTAEAPAKIFGMYPRKGVIAAGSDADLLIWDPQAEYTIEAVTQSMHTDYSIFEGFKVKGNVRQVFSRAELVVENGRFLGKVGRGEYLKRELGASV